MEGPDTSNDLLLAQMLQLEFDRQHDRLVGAEERVYNRDSKGEGVGVCVCVWGGGETN